MKTDAKTKAQSSVVTEVLATRAPEQLLAAAGDGRALKPGDVLAGRYEVESEIGRGGASVVFRAYDRATKEAVAVKVLTGANALDDEWLARLGRELKLGRRGRHPNVCEVYDLMEAGGFRFLTMALAAGGTLRDTLRGAGHRDWRDRIQDVRWLVAGLAALHADGIVHRDVKPENVLRMEDGRLVLSDLGLAVSRGPATVTGVDRGGAGTPPYMAPEVALGAEASLASDVFSLGVVVHEILFGGRPRWESAGGKGFVAVPQLTRPSSAQRRLSRLCLECLEPVPGQRPRSAVEVKLRLERALVGRFGSVTAALRAHRWAIGGAACLSIAVSAATVIAVKSGGEAAGVELTGVARDWTARGHLLGRHDGPVQCLYPGEDERTVRVIWGRPFEAAVVNLIDGKVEPWALDPRTFANQRCPHWSPDGGSVLFTTGPPMQQVVELSERSDGRDARVIGTGHSPRWLPGMRHIVYGFDRRRLATTPLDVPQPSLVPEAARPEETLYTLEVAPDGKSVVAFYADFGAGHSAVVTYENPTWRTLRRLELPGLMSMARPIRFEGVDGTLLITLEERLQDTVSRLRPDSTFTRLGSMGGLAIADLIVRNGDTLVAAHRRTGSINVTLPGGEVRTVAQARRMSPLSFAPNGDAVFAEHVSDGRRRIMLYDSGSKQARPLTEGPDHEAPIFFRDGRRVAFIENEPRSIRICQLDSGRCPAVLFEARVLRLLGTSPAGDKLAYFGREGSAMLMRVLTLDTGKVETFGPLESGCNLRWETAERFWMFARGRAFTGWTELDMTTRRPTGRREAVNLDPLWACPEHADHENPGWPRRVAQDSAEIWRIPGPLN